MEQSASLPGNTPPSSALFLRARSLALRAASRARAAESDFSMMAFAALGFSSRKMARCSLIAASTAPRTSLLPSLVLVCPSNLGLHDFDAEDAGQPLPNVIAREALVCLLEQVAPAGVVVDGARQSRLEARKVGPALVRVDVVDEGVSCSR